MFDSWSWNRYPSENYKVETFKVVYVWVNRSQKKKISYDFETWIHIISCQTAQVKGKYAEHSRHIFYISILFCAVWVGSHERKNICFHEKYLKLTENNTSNNVFWNKIFPYSRFLPVFQKWLNFHKSWLLFWGKIFSTTLPFSLLR